MSEENKAVVRRLIAEVINEHDPNAAERFFTADFVEHIPAPGKGRASRALGGGLRRSTSPPSQMSTGAPKSRWQKGTRCSLASYGVAPIGASSRA